MAAKSVPLARGLADALRRRATGSIASTGKAPARRLWISAGVPVYVESLVPEEKLTTALGRKKALTRTEILLIEEEFSGAGIREEAAVLASGMLTQTEIAEFGQQVFEDRLAGAFDVAGPVWTFDEEKLPADLTVYETSAAMVILRGLRGRMTKERLALEFPVGADDHFVHEPSTLGAFPEVVLSPLEASLAGALDGESSWSEVLTEMKLEPVDAQSALYAMAVLGIAAFHGNAAPTRASGSASAADRIGAPLPSNPAIPISEAVKLGGYGRAAEMRERAAKDLPEVIDVAIHAPGSSIDKAAKAIVARFDLGRAHQLPEAEREAAILLLDRVAEAFLVMTHPSSRARYFEAPAWDRETIAAGLASKLGAEKQFFKAGVYLQAGNHLAAEAAMLSALQLEPRESRFHLRMGIAIYSRAKARGDGKIPAGAARALEKAAAFDPKNAQPWIYLAQIALGAGNPARAKVLYEHAMRLDPSSEEARAGYAGVRSS